MPTILDPIKTKKILLWVSFFVCLALTLSLGIKGSNDNGPIGFLPALVCLIPWLLHRTYLRPKLDLLSETSPQNFGGMTVLILAFVAVVNVSLILLGFGLKILEIFQFDISGDLAGFFFLVMFIGLVFLFFYMLVWGIDNLNSIPYYSALQKSMAVIALPAIFILVSVLMQPDFAKFAFNRGYGHVAEFFYSMVLVWCGLLLSWAVVPGLYLILMAKTYKEYQRLAAESDSEGLEFDAFEAEEGLPDWYMPDPASVSETN
jgi:hypothetical protein